MTTGRVGQHSIAPYTEPQNTPQPGDALDANVVRGNDNDTASAYNDHDSDATIHYQTYTYATLPAAGTPGRVFVTTDSPRRVFIDTGTVLAPLDYASAGTTLPDQYFYIFATDI